MKDHEIGANSHAGGRQYVIGEVRGGEAIDMLQRCTRAPTEVDNYQRQHPARAWHVETMIQMTACVLDSSNRQQIAAALDVGLRWRAFQGNSQGHGYSK